MPINYSKLKGKIREVCGTDQAFAAALGISNVALSQKLSCKTGFRQREIIKAIEILKLSDDDIHDYFFSVEV